MKIDALDHPKTYDLAARLDVSLPTAIGHLELLFVFVARQSPAGNVGKWPDGAISRAAHWMGDPARFVDALVDSGFFERDSGHRLLVHDWQDHCPRWVKAKLNATKTTFAQPTVGITGSTIVSTVGSTRREEKRRQGKVREEKQICPTNGALDDNRFDEFWRRYPRKEAKTKTVTAWSRLSKPDREAAIADCGTRYLHTEPAYVPLPTSYLHGRRWEDDPLPPKTAAGRPEREGKLARAMRAFEAAENPK
jgi:hypothetical protein